MKDTSGPAFPGQPYRTGGDPGYPSSQRVIFDPGLTKREWFAGMALQGLLSVPEEQSNYETTDDLARGAVEAADALLAELRRRSHE